LAWRAAKLRVETADEVRKVIETDVEGDRGDGSAAGGEALGGSAQARSHEPLVRRNARDELEGAQEVIGAHVCFTRKFAEAVGVLQRGA